MAIHTIAHYRILEKIGEGGMGVVYKAEDTKLERTVALKFLPAEMTRDAQAKARFIQEARAAAALDHPNICAVFEIGEAEGTTYIAMPYVKGQSLKDRISGGPIPLDDALDIARQVGEGLKEAHERGIVHRDIKPANIMLTEKGQAKIMDFGLAKLASSPDVTKTLAVMGTVAYMSPEQARGETVDQRTDIWSFGATLYEMLTGQMPFGRKHDQALIYSILNEAPEPLIRVRPEIPNQLELIVQKALAKDKSSRYQNMSELLKDLAAVRTLGPAMRTPEKSIIVLPFEDISPGKDNEYFSDGLTEEIITDLSHVHDLLVISRSSAMTFKGMKKKIGEIAHDVNVRYVLEGSVRKAGNNLRITAQLIDSSSDAHIWSEKYMGTLDDVFDIQEKVSRSIVDALQVTLSPEEKRKIVERPINDTAAYEWYLRAMGAASRYTEESLVEALRYFNCAIEAIGPDALLYSGMADTYLRLVNVGVEIQQSREKAEEFVHKALALNREMPKARALLGQLGIWYAGGKVNLKEAAAQFKWALAVDPNEPVALLGLGCVYFWAGRITAAVPLADRLRKMEPLNVVVLFIQGASHFYEGRYEVALDIWHNLYDLDPKLPGSTTWSTWQCWCAHALAYNQRIDEALTLINEAAATNPNVYQTRLALMLKHALLGDKQGALQELTPDFYEYTRKDPTWSHRIASDFAFLNAKEEALDWLENAVNLGHINYPLFAEKDPFLANIRSEPRFQKLMERVKDEWEHFEV